MKLRNQAVVNIIGNVIYLFSQWVLTVITTRVLGYEIVGELTLAMAVGNTFAFIQLYGIRNYQTSDLKKRYSTGDYLNTRLITVTLGFLLCALFVIIYGYSSSVGIAILLFTLFRTSDTFSDVLFGDIQRNGHLELAGVSMFVRGVLTIVFFWVFLCSFHNLNIALLAIAIENIIVTSLLDRYWYKKYVIRIRSTREGRIGLLKECFPLFCASLLPSVTTAFPRIVLERFYGAELLGYYGNVYTPAVIITALVPNVLAAVMPEYGRLVNEKDFRGIIRLWGRTIVITIGIFLFMLLVVFAVGKHILAWIYSDEIIPYVPHLYLILVATLLYAITMCNTAVLVAFRKNLLIGLLSFMATIICVAVSYPLIEYNGILGANITLIVAYFPEMIFQIAVIFLIIHKMRSKRTHAESKE